MKWWLVISHYVTCEFLYSSVNKRDKLSNRCPVQRIQNPSKIQEVHMINDSITCTRGLRLKYWYYPILVKDTVYLKWWSWLVFLFFDEVVASGPIKVTPWPQFLTSYECDYDRNDERPCWDFGTEFQANTESPNLPRVY